MDDYDGRPHWGKLHFQRRDAGAALSPMGRSATCSRRAWIRTAPSPPRHRAPSRPGWLTAHAASVAATAQAKPSAGSSTARWNRQPVSGSHGVPREPTQLAHDRAHLVGGHGHTSSTPPSAATAHHAPNLSGRHAAPPTVGAAAGADPRQPGHGGRRVELGHACPRRAQRATAAERGRLQRPRPRLDHRTRRSTPAADRAARWSTMRRRSRRPAGGQLCTRRGRQGGRQGTEPRRPRTRPADGGLPALQRGGRSSTRHRRRPRRAGPRRAALVRAR